MQYVGTSPSDMAAFNMTLRQQRRLPWFSVIILAGITFTLSLLIGQRDLDAGTDTRNYVSAYEELRSCNCFPGRHEPGFEAISLLPATMGAPSSFYLWYLSAVGLLMTWIVLGQMASFEDGVRQRVKFFAYVFAWILLSPLFLSAQTNGIRQGVAAIALGGVLVSYERGNVKQAALWGLMALSLHVTSILYLLSLSLLRTPRALRIAVLSAAALFYTVGASEYIVMHLSSIFRVPVYDIVAGYGERAALYYRSGPRLDFVVATLAGVLLVSVVAYLLDTVTRHRVKFYLDSVMCMSLPFLLMGWGYYSNRYLFTPWLIISLSIGVATFGLARKLPSYFALLFVIIAASIVAVQLLVL